MTVYDGCFPYVEWEIAGLVVAWPSERLSCAVASCQAFRAVALERLQTFSARGLRLSDVPEGAEFEEIPQDV